MYLNEFAFLVLVHNMKPRGATSSLGYTSTVAYLVLSSLQLYILKDKHFLKNPGIPVFPVLIKPNQLFYILSVITKDSNNNNNNSSSNQIKVKKRYNLSNLMGLGAGGGGSDFNAFGRNK